jgi:radical SAM superfamily enzyme YgiQ (UPF0313 family)
MKRLQSVGSDVFGFSSICSSYPLTVRLAQRIRQLYPAAFIIFGGPQASVVDVPTLRNFPCVDFVIRGEADETFVQLLELIAAGGRRAIVDHVPGITFRHAGEVIKAPNASVMSDLDNLPLPAFDLDDDLKSRGSIHLEMGRGCPFACTFCSTNDFFRRNFRLKSPAVMIEQMRWLRAEYGIGNFSLIHDMYTVDRRKVVEFCEQLLASDEQFTWTCSARTDCIDDDLIALMAKAGCRGIFFGIETGSERLQLTIKKKLNLSEARERIRCADRHGMTIAVALISAFPDETLDDLRDTIHFFVDSLRFDHAEPQLSLLAPLAATPIYEDYKHHLVLDHIFSDISYQGWQQDQGDAELINEYPEVFPNFYAVPTRWLPRAYFKEVRDFVTYLAFRFRWLSVALMQDWGDLLKVFDRWKVWLAANPRNSVPSFAPYYCRRQFREDFLEFVSSCYVAEMARAPLAIAALVRIEETPWSVTPPSAASQTQIEGLIGDHDYPFLNDLVTVVELEVDYQELIRSLRTGSDLRRMPQRETTIALHRKDERRIQVWQLTPSSVTLLRLCNGARSVKEIVEEFTLLDRDLISVSARQACLFGLMSLVEAGFINIAQRQAAAKANDTAVEPPMPHYSPPPELFNTQQPWPWPSDWNGN